MRNLLLTTCTLIHLVENRPKNQLLSENISQAHTDLKLYFWDITGDVTRTRERRRKAKKTNSLTLDALLVELTGKLHGS